MHGSINQIEKMRQRRQLKTRQSAAALTQKVRQRTQSPDLDASIIFSVGGAIMMIILPYGEREKEREEEREREK